MSIGAVGVADLNEQEDSVINHADNAAISHGSLTWLRPDSRKPNLVPAIDITARKELAQIPVAQVPTRNITDLLALLKGDRS